MRAERASKDARPRWWPSPFETRFALLNLNSATKSVVSSLVAMLRKDGVLDSFEHPVLDLFADRDVANVDERKKVWRALSRVN